MTSDAGEMEGCRSLVVAHDPTGPDVMGLAEALDGKERRPAPVDRPGVRAPLDAAIPLAKDWGPTVETKVVTMPPG